MGYPSDRDFEDARRNRTPPKTNVFEKNAWTSAPVIEGGIFYAHVFYNCDSPQHTPTLMCWCKPDLELINESDRAFLVRHCRAQ